jgi:parvulin-like peptidyl-prolyl isomerase
VKKASIICTFALAAATVAAAEQGKPAPTAKTDPVIITANGIAIHKSEFEGAVKTLPAQSQEFAMGPGKRQFADNYLRMRLLAAQGAKDGLQNSPDVQRQLAVMRANVIATAELKKIENGIAVSSAEVKAYYEANKKNYEQVHARHILIAPKGSAAAKPGQKELTDAEAKAKAEELRAKLVAGADFAQLAKTESADVGSGANGGDLGSFGRGQMVPEFEKAAFEAKPGEITPVVKTQFGYHIIKVESHEITPLEQARPAIEKAIRPTKMQARLDAMKNSAGAKYDEAYFAGSKP